ncbi:MAG: hypothetical protein MRY21_00785 [Simkaniaceae bacterium]|nr:hypothetical protein [Simkaniaceae bacterium]
MISYQAFLQLISQLLQSPTATIVIAGRVIHVDVKEGEWEISSQIDEAPAQHLEELFHEDGGFRFLQKSGFLRREKLTGAIHFCLRFPPMNRYTLFRKSMQEFFSQQEEWQLALA